MPDKNENVQFMTDKDVARPGCSWMPDSSVNNNAPAFHIASSELIMPIPKVKQGIKRNTRNNGRIASSPVHHIKMNWKKL
ncbi:hypothetical protein JTB14_018385 [Gonioctena quinquepunctata]|nr:hypothetical protein JTB14_018385 [Gonioctena quinquepunctata]